MNNENNTSKQHFENLEYVKQGLGRFPFIAKFFVKTRKPTMYLVLLLIVLTVGIFFLNKLCPQLFIGLVTFEFSPIKLNYVDLLTVIATLVVLFVWWSELKEDWGQSLSSFISVTYFEPIENQGSEHLDYRKVHFLQQYLVPVSDKGDIRSLAQSLSQMRCNNTRLNFNSEKFGLTDTICRDSTNKKSRFYTPFVHYEVSMYLLQPIDKADDKQIPESQPDTPIVESNPEENIIDLFGLYTGDEEESALVENLPKYKKQVLKLAGDGRRIILTGRAPIWMYLYLAHELHGKVETLHYRSPVLKEDLLIINHKSTKS